MSKISLDSDAVLYLDDFKQRLEEIESLVLKLTDDKNFKEINNQIQRIIHSLKGAAGSYGFDLLTTVCHRLEDLFITLEFNDISFVVDSILGLLDNMNEICIAYREHDQKALRLYQEQCGVLFDKRQFFDLKADESIQQNITPKFQHERKSRVLVIENSKILTRTIVKSFSNTEVEIAVARDGYEGLGRLLKEKFDFLICSLHIANIDAESLFKILEIVPNFNLKIKTILLTSSKSHTDHILKENLIILEKNSNLEGELKKTVSNYLPQKTIKIEETLTKPLKLLLIDDSIEIFRLVKISLKNYPNIELNHCMDPRQAESDIKKVKPKIVLLDIQMPHINGDVLYKELIAKSLLKESLVIFLTGTDKEVEVERLKKLGALGVIKKPFSPKWLVQQMSTVVGISNKAS